MGAPSWYKNQCLESDCTSPRAKPPIEVWPTWRRSHSDDITGQVHVAYCLDGRNMQMLHYAVSECRRQSLADTVRSRPTSLYMITLVMIWRRVLPHGMDGCSSQIHFMVFSVLFLGLVIFQSPLFPDAVFQRSLINWFTPWVWDCFPPV